MAEQRSSRGGGQWSCVLSILMSLVMLAVLVCRIPQYLIEYIKTSRLAARAVHGTVARPVLSV